MKRFAILLAATLAWPAHLQAMETRFSAMVSDLETGFILTADRIDAPRDPSLLGRLASLALGIQDLSGGSLALNEQIPIQSGEAMSISTALRMTALGERGYRAPMTALVNRVGQNAHIFTLRIDAIEDMAGLKATEMHIRRGQDGGPAFEGYTTPRDMSRLAVSLLRAYPDLVDDVFAPATGNIESTHIWLYQGGVCLLAADGPRSHRPLIAVMTGAPDQATCLERAAELISGDDRRIASARKDHRR